MKTIQTTKGGFQSPGKNDAGIFQMSTTKIKFPLVSKYQTFFLPDWKPTRY